MLDHQREVYAAALSHRRENQVKGIQRFNGKIAMALATAWIATGALGLDLDLVRRGSWPGFKRGPARAVVVQNQFAYVSLEMVGLAIFDVSNPANPRRVGGYESGGGAGGLAVSGNYAYLAEDRSGLEIIDISDPANPRPPDKPEALPGVG